MKRIHDDFHIPKKKKCSKEDKRLQNWKKWIMIRKKFHSKMFHLHHRPPNQLMVNAADYQRRKVEDHMLFEYSKIPQVGKRKEDLQFWTMPLASTRFPALTYVMKREQLFEIPSITYADIPRNIKKEKGFSSGESTQTDVNRVGQYRDQQLHERREEIEKFQPHKPDLDKLIIIGKAFGQQKSPRPEVAAKANVDVISHATLFSIKPTDVYLPITSLTVENHEYTFEFKSQIEKNHCIVIDYDFEAQQIIKNKIVLKNTGDVAIRYYWKRILPKRSLLNIIPQRLTTFSFVFEKSEVILPPHHDTVLEIFFQADRLGIHQEDWELITQPDVFQEGSFILKLWAIAEIKNYKSLMDAIQERIEEGLKQTIIEKTLLNAIEEALVISEGRAIGNEEFEVTEKDIFEVLNADFNGVVYYYNKIAVSELKEFYKEIRSPHDPKKWNLKIRDIRRIIFRDEHMDRRHEFLSNFQYIMESFDKTDFAENTDAYKHTKVLQLLCIMIDQMTEHVMNFREKYKIPIIETYPAITEAQLSFFENAQNMYIWAKFSARSFDPINIEEDSELEEPPLDAEEAEKEAEKAERLRILKTIPFDQIDKRLKIYRKEKYGIIPSDEELPPVVEPKKGKKGKDKDVSINGNKDKKEKEPKVKPKEQHAVPKLSINISPTERLLTDTIIIKPQYMDDENYVEPTKGAFCTYYHNIYVGIYTILSETVSEMVMILEFIASRKKISRGLLKKCIEYGIPVLQSEHEFYYGEGEGEGGYEYGLNNRYLLNHQYDELRQTFSILDIPEPTESLSSLTRSISSNTRSKFFFGLTEQETQTDRQGIYRSREHVIMTQTEDKDFEEADNYSLIEHIEQPFDSTSVQMIHKPKVHKRSTPKVKVIAKMKNFKDSDSDEGDVNLAQLT